MYVIVLISVQYIQSWLVYVMLMKYCFAYRCQETIGWCHGWYKEIICICSAKTKRFCCNCLWSLHFLLQTMTLKVMPSFFNINVENLGAYKWE